jgi:hypothetical protein
MARRKMKFDTTTVVLIIIIVVGLLIYFGIPAKMGLDGHGREKGTVLYKLEVSSP